MGLAHVTLNDVTPEGASMTMTNTVVLVMDGIGVIGTIGFFVPAGIITALVAGAVIRDRRSGADEERDRAV